MSIHSNDRFLRARLGLFGKLPGEIRTQIMEQVLAESITGKPTFLYAGYACQSLKSWINPLSGKRTPRGQKRLSQYEKELQTTVIRFTKSSENDPFLSIRKTSRPVAQELDIAFLSKRHLYLDNPGLFEDFVLWQAVRDINKAVRLRIAIRLLPIDSDDWSNICKKMNEWNRAIETLPSNLGHLAINISFTKDIPDNWEDILRKLEEILKKARDVVQQAKIDIGVSFVGPKSRKVAAVREYLEGMAKDDEQVIIQKR